MLKSVLLGPKVNGLSSRLIGVWTLVAYTEEKKGFRDTNPLGPKPAGFLIYTPDGLCPHNS
jgi:hypothetical protein